MAYSPKPHKVGIISNWASEVCPGAPSQCSATSSQKTSTSKTQTHTSSRTGTAPPSSTAPSSSIGTSVLTKSLAVSEPGTAQGLYRRPPKAHPLPKTVPKNATLVSKVTGTIKDKQEDIEMVDGYVDEEQGPIPMEDENRSTNTEFQCALDTPAKAKQLTKNTKVHTKALSCVAAH